MIAKVSKKDRAWTVTSLILFCALAVAFACQKGIVKTKSGNKASNHSSASTPADSRFEAILFVPDQGCDCNFLSAYASLDETVARDQLPCRITLATRSEKIRDSLKMMGVPAERLVVDTKGRLFRERNLAEEDLPCFILLQHWPRETTLAFLHLSPIEGEQRLAGQILATVQSLPDTSENRQPKE